MTNSTFTTGGSTAECEDGLAVTVLVVDDDPMIRELLVMMLDSPEYKVLSAESGEQAREVVQSLEGVTIAVLITDLCMPGMSGVELAIAARAVRPDIKTIFTSGYSHEEMTAMCGGFPESVHLSKPFKATMVKQAIRSVLASTPVLC